MKKHFLFLLMSCSLMTFTSCTGQKTENKETEQQTEQVVEEVHRLADYAFTDSLMMGSHNVVYDIKSECAEDLPIVVDEDGVKYMDNRFTLNITKDGQAFFHHAFTKTDFKSQLSEDFQKYGIMDGLRFNRAEEGMIYFNTCVSYPDSDMSCPFILTIGPDGSYTITPDTSIDEENLPPAPDPQEVTTEGNE